MSAAGLSRRPRPATTAVILLVLFRFSLDLDLEEFIRDLFMRTETVPHIVFAKFTDDDILDEMGRQL